MVALVAVADLPYTVGDCFDYLVPDSLAEKAVAGARVVVPFGGANKRRNGIILSLSDTSDYEKTLKSITFVASDELLIDSELISLSLWMSEQYMCPVYDCLRTMLPAGLSYKIENSYSFAADDESLEGLDSELLEYIRANSPSAEKRIFTLFGEDAQAALSRLIKKNLITKTQTEKRNVGDNKITEVFLDCMPEQLDEYYQKGGPAAEKHRRVTDYLLAEDACEKSDLIYMTGVSDSVINTLKKRQIIGTRRREVFRTPFVPSEKECADDSLNADQQAAADIIAKNFGAYSANLLYGVTGSGKTHVFYSLLDRVIAEGRSAIVMVPEIMLTVQMVYSLNARYGDIVAVMHSSLSAGQRLDEWKRMKTGAAKIAVGTRTAVFAPFTDIGLIIIDEEQEHTYKSELSPRFCTKSVAKRRAAFHKAALVFASATPSLESFYLASQKIYHYAELPARFNRQAGPPVHIVDMRCELAAGNSSPISTALANELTENIERGEQSILFINRRGYSSFISCRSCGFVAKCPNCSIALTYHKKNNRLMCHYCGHSQQPPEICPECGSEHIRFFGTGTQKIEEELAKSFPGANMLRMDADTTTRRYAHETMLSQFADGKYNVLLGTQMVTKGLDFPNVTLVGVLAADTSLYSDDYRANERTFSLISQVIGRAGRADKLGRAVIQTYTPDHEVLSFACAQDYKGFYEYEICMRKILLYPPFSDLCQIIFSASSALDAADGAKQFKDMLVVALQNRALPVVGLGPSPCGIMMMNNKYRYKLLLKCKASRALRDLLRELLSGFYEKFKNIGISIDFNPYNIQ